MSNTNTHPLVPNPDSVTHWSCPARSGGGLGAGDPHYVLAIVAGGEVRCIYCNRTADDLRNEQAEILAGNTEYGSLTDEEKRLTALTAFIAEQIEIDGNNGDATPEEYARFALVHNTNPLNLADWAPWVPTADDPLCAVATWVNDEEHGVFYVWSARGVRFGLNDAFDLARASHPTDDGPSDITMLGMTLFRRADGTTCRWDDDKSVVTEWVFKL